jgi:hypothetical protein
MGYPAHALYLTRFKGIGEEFKIIAQIKHRENSEARLNYLADKHESQFLLSEYVIGIGYS